MGYEPLVDSKQGEYSGASQLAYTTCLWVMIASRPLGCGLPGLLLAKGWKRR